MALKRYRAGPDKDAWAHQRTKIAVTALIGVAITSPKLVSAFNNNAPSWLSVSKDSLVAIGSALTSAAFIGWLLLQFTRSDQAANTAAESQERDAREQRELRLELSSTSDLSGRDLRYLDLRHLKLARKRLVGTDLRGADLRFTDLNAADLRGADLRGADLRYSSQESVLVDGLIWDARTRTDRASDIAERMLSSTHGVDEQNNEKNEIIDTD